MSATSGMPAGYEAAYFVPTVRRTLDDLFAERGFGYAGEFRGVSVCWACDSRFVSVGYMPETLPRYELLGAGEADVSAQQLPSRGNEVGVWRLLPPDIAPQIADWRFDSPQALERELRRAWSQAIVPYVMPALQENGRLRNVFAQQNAEADAERRHQLDARLLRHAREQFSAGRFAETVKAYDELPADALTAADRKRRDIAWRRM